MIWFFGGLFVYGLIVLALAGCTLVFGGMVVESDPTNEDS